MFGILAHDISKKEAFPVDTPGCSQLFLLLKEYFSAEGSRRPFQSNIKMNFEHIDDIFFTVTTQAYFSYVHILSLKCLLIWLNPQPLLDRLVCSSIRHY